MSVMRLVGCLLVLVVAHVAAQIPVSQEPRHRVQFANAQFHILDVNIPPGDTSLDHRHEFDLATVSMSSGTETRVQATGQPWGMPRASRPIGDSTVATYAGSPGSHRIENVGTSAYRLFAVENLKTSGWSTAPPMSGLATTLTRESRAFRIYDVQLAKNIGQTSHTHQVNTITVLISGKALSDGPDAQAKANAPAAVGLRQLDQPGQWVLVPAGDTHHLVRLGITDTRIVEIEVR